MIQLFVFFIGENVVSSLIFARYEQMIHIIDSIYSSFSLDKQEFYLSPLIKLISFHS